MKITNRFNLPKPILDALTTDKHEKTGDYSVTELIGPPKISQLLKRHDHEIEEDASERVWRLLGHMVHDLIARMNTGSYISEELMEVMVGEEDEAKKVSGKPDLFHPQDGILYDFKVTSVWSFVLGKEGLKPEFIAQMNLYAYLLKMGGGVVNELKIIAILKDWTINKVGDNGYPKCQIHVVKVPLWDDERMESYITSRVKLHNIASEMGDDDIPECLPEERWEKPTTWRIEKEGRKTAVRVLESEEDAKGFLDGINKEKSKHKIVERQGECTRCLKYCAVKEFCHFGRELE